MEEWWKGEAGAGDVMCGIFGEEAVTGEGLGPGRVRGACCAYLLLQRMPMMEGIGSNETVDGGGMREGHSRLFFIYSHRV